jgi:hypothetical protein
LKAFWSLTGKDRCLHPFVARALGKDGVADLLASRLEDKSRSEGATLLPQSLPELVEGPRMKPKAKRAAPI